MTKLNRNQFAKNEIDISLGTPAIDKNSYLGVYSVRLGAESINGNDRIAVLLTEQEVDDLIVMLEYYKQQALDKNREEGLE